MRFSFFFALCVCLLALPVQARALSDDEHLRFSQEFPAYAQAEQRLSTAWRHLKRLLSKEEFQALLEEQRVWLRTGRDAEARSLVGGTFKDDASMARAYAVVTERRAAGLEARSKVLSAAIGKTPDKTPAKPDTTLPSPAAVSQQNEQTKPDKESRDVARLVIGSYGEGGNLVEVRETAGKGYYVAVSTSAPDGRWICEMQGVGELENGVLRIVSVSTGKKVMVPIEVKEDLLIVPATQGAVCGTGGSIEGSYKKKR